jgi:hypothetical protein
MAPASGTFPCRSTNLISGILQFLADFRRSHDEPGKQTRLEPYLKRGSRHHGERKRAFPAQVLRWQLAAHRYFLVVVVLAHEDESP